MLRAEVERNELLAMKPMLAYAHWVWDIVFACEPLWHKAIAKDPQITVEEIDQELQKIPFDAPDTVKMAMVREAERIGFTLAPAFLDMKVKLAPNESAFQWISNMGAVSKGTEKLMDKLHHYLYMALGNPSNSYPTGYSNIIAMRGMMARDYGAFRNLLWVIGKHDIKAGFEVDLTQHGVPPQPVLAYDEVTDALIHGDFFKWLDLWVEELDVFS